MEQMPKSWTSSLRKGSALPGRTRPHVTPRPLLSLHRVDNNHLLLLMIHVFRENEEQLFRVRWRQSVSRAGLALGLCRPRAEHASLRTDDPNEHRAHGGKPAADLRPADGLLRVPHPERYPTPRPPAAGREPCLLQKAEHPEPSVPVPSCPLERRHPQWAAQVALSPEKPWHTCPVAPRCLRRVLVRRSLGAAARWPRSGQRWGPLSPVVTRLFVSVPGAAEKPYMVEEAVSYNELDYVSVSLGVGPHLAGCRAVRSVTVGCFCPRGCFGQ